MDTKIALLVLIVLGTSWTSDARMLVITSFSSGETVTSDFSDLLIKQHITKREFIKPSGEVGIDENLCVLCEDFAADAINFLEDNTTRTKVIDALHNTCSTIPPFAKQCLSMVDYYVPFLFSEIESVQPDQLCQKISLCDGTATRFHLFSDNKCQRCNDAVSEVIEKLKDPDTKLEIIEVLLKACNSLENNVKKCKTLVFEYGPLILTNAVHFLETTDICSAIHACRSPPVSNQSDIVVEEETPLLSAS